VKDGPGRQAEFYPDFFQRNPALRGNRTGESALHPAREHALFARARDDRARRTAAQLCENSRRALPVMTAIAGCRIFRSTDIA
jgi:hypothetical protein